MHYLYQSTNSKLIWSYKRATLSPEKINQRNRECKGPDRSILVSLVPQAMLKEI